MAKATKTRKVSISLKDVRKYVFWVAVPILVLIAFYFTGNAKTAIKEKFDAKKSQVEGEKSAIDKIVSNDKHPNDDTVNAIAAEKEVLSKNVYEAWMLMYQDQKARNRWPRQLSDEFLNIVRNAKFKDPIGVGKPYILEDYAYFMVNNLPELIKNSNRRRCQVKEYQFVEDQETPENSRFEPVYVCSAKEIKEGLAEKPTGELLEQLDQMERTGEDFLYVVTEAKNVYVYNIRDDFLAPVEESSLRDYLIGIKDKVPYYREMDPMIANPREFVGTGTGNTRSAGSLLDGEGNMGGGSQPFGGARSNARSNTGMGAAMNTGAIPGDGIDPAVNQVVQSGTGNQGTPRNIGAGNMPGELYAGLPPYAERRRVVGNIDWLSPEIFSLLRWGQGQVPLSIEIWYLQEDLWVYESLIRVLVETNKEATDNISLAPVKCIEQMLIGKDASTAWATLKSLSLIGGISGDSMAASSSSTSASFARESDELSMDEDEEGPSVMLPGGNRGKGMGGISGLSTGSEALGEEGVLNNILNGRYLDAQDNPLEAGTAAPFAEFNRMPICLKLVVDQRRIQDVLVNCANCSMPIDIRHVRVCPDNNAGTGNSSMNMGGGASMQAGGGRNMASRAASTMSSDDDAPSTGGMAGRPGSISLGRSELSQTGGYGADAIRIEIYGIINIFNEPDPEIFGTGIIEEEEKADGEATEKDASEEGVPAETIPAAGGEAGADAPDGAAEEQAPADGEETGAAATDAPAEQTPETP